MLAQGQHCPRSTLAYAVKQRVMMGIVTEREKEAQNRFCCRFVEHRGEERETEREGAVEFVYSCYLSGRIWPELVTLLRFACLYFWPWLCGEFIYIRLPLHSLSIIHL